MTGGFGGTFGDVFGTTTTTTGGGGFGAIKAAIGQGQNDGTFWDSVQNRWNSLFTPNGQPMPFTHNNTFAFSGLSQNSPTGFANIPTVNVVRVEGNDIVAIGNGSQDGDWFNAGLWMGQMSNVQRTNGMTDGTVYTRLLTEGDGNWEAWGIGSSWWNGHLNTVRDYNKAWRRIAAGIVSGFSSVASLTHLKFSWNGDYGWANGNGDGASDSASNFTLWNQIFDGVSGDPGIASYLPSGQGHVADCDAYGNGGGLRPPSDPWLSQWFTNWQAWAAGRGLRVGHSELGIGQWNGDTGPWDPDAVGQVNSGPPHYWSPAQWAATHINWWKQLPAGMLAYICLFDEGQVDKSVDWRTASFAKFLFPGTSGIDDGTNFANALKSAALTADHIAVTGTGLLTGGGTLAATGHQSIILLTDHPEVDGTGATDCSDQWQAIINAAPNGTIIRAQAGATYLVNASGSGGGTINDSGATMVLDSTRNFLQIDGNGCTFTQTVNGPYTTTKTDATSVAVVKRRNLHRAFFSLLGADHCKIYNATFIGPSPFSGTADGAYDSRYESQHIFNLEGVDDFEEYGNTAHHNWGDFCAMQPDVGSGISCSNIHLHDYTYHDNGRQHLTLNAVTDLLVENANAFNIRHAQVDLEPNFTSRALKPQIKRCVFRNVTFGFMRLNMFSAGNTEVADVDTITFDTCTFFQWKMPDVEGPWTGNRRKNLTIINCTVSSTNPFGGPPVTGTKLAPNGFGVTSTHGVGLGVQQWDGVTVTGNTIYLQARNPTMVAVWCLDCTGINVKNNILHGTLFEIEIGVTPGTGTVGTGLLAGGGTLAATGFPTLLATSAVLVGGGTLTAAGTVGVIGTGSLDGGGDLQAAGLAFTIVDVAGTGLLDGGGDLSAVGLVLELGDGFLDGGGVLVAAGDVGAVDATGLLDGGGDLSASASVGGIGIFGTGLLDGGGTLTATGRRHRKHGWHIGPIRLRPPGYGNAPYGKEPYGGLN